jgi:hypothetical protein
MTLGPIEIVEIGFAQGTFDGSILPELEKLVDAGTISIVDGLFISKTGENDLTILELSEVTDDDSLSALSALMASTEGLLSEDDVEVLAEALPVGAAAAVLCFEHTWVKPLRDAIVGAGGELLASVRVPGAAVDEVLAAVRELGDDEGE